MRTAGLYLLWTIVAAVLILTAMTAETWLVDITSTGAPTSRPAVTR